MTPLTLELSWDDWNSRIKTSAAWWNSICTVVFKNDLTLYWAPVSLTVGAACTACRPRPRWYPGGPCLCSHGSCRPRQPFRLRRSERRGGTPCHTPPWRWYCHHRCCRAPAAAGSPWPAATPDDRCGAGKGGRRERVRGQTAAGESSDTSQLFPEAKVGLNSV